MNWRRWWWLLRRSKMERELAEEMEAHREMMGDPKSFGGMVRLRESASDVWGWRWLDDLRVDLRHGARLFASAPGFTFTAITVLALGMGVNLGLFHLLNAALFEPSQLRDPDTLVRLSHAARNQSSGGLAYPLARMIERDNTVFSAVLLEQHSRTAWGDHSEFDASAAFVTSNYFDELGAGAIRGRLFQPGEDDRPDAPLVVAVSHDFWRSRLGGRMDVVGSTLKLNGRAATIVGVATSGFFGTGRRVAEIWAPVEQTGRFFPGSKIESSWTHDVDTYARLAPGVREVQAAGSLARIAAASREQHPAEMGEEPRIVATPGHRRFRTVREDQEVQAVLGLVTGICLLVLATACANLASLMISRMSARSSEFAMRIALGAGKLRLARQLAAECSLLVAAGLIAGWFLGYWIAVSLAIRADAPFAIPLWPSARLIIAALAVFGIALAIVGIVPALRASGLGGLKANARANAAFQRVLVGVQAAGSCVLLLIAGAAARKLQSVLETPLGFQIDNVAVLDVSLARYGVRGGAASEYWRAVRSAAAADSRIAATALSNLAPLGPRLHSSGYRDAPGLQVTAMTVDPSFLPMFGIRIMSGRNLREGDTRATAIVISRRLAERMYGTVDVLGQGFPKTSDGPRPTIVGVAADTNLIRIGATNTAEQYSPLEDSDRAHALLLARIEGGNIEVLREAASRAHPGITPSVRWLRAGLENRMRAPKLEAACAGALGLVATGLTMTGIFGLVAYTVTRRTREIGIRSALGASPASVSWLVVRGLTGPALLGTAAGVTVVIAGLAGILRGQPLFMDPAEPRSVAAGLLLLAAAIVSASMVPAVRAARIDPSRALREQ